MIDFKADIEGNLVFENNDLVLVTGLEQLMQRLFIRLSMLYGEWFLNITKGIKYDIDIFIKKPNLATIEAIFKVAILEDSEIDSINSFSMNLDNKTRKLSVNANIATVYGSATLNKELDIWPTE